jgi:hypothetical protein
MFPLPGFVYISVKGLPYKIGIFSGMVAVIV